MIFLQKKRDSKRNLFLKIKNIICYYQTFFFIFKSGCLSISKHHMLLPNISEKTKILTELSFQNIICYYQTNLELVGAYYHAEFQNIICYYQTLKRSFLLLSFLYFKTSYVITKQQPVRWYEFDYLISKHHMLLPNFVRRIHKPFYKKFQNIICYYQTLCDLLYPCSLTISKHHMLLPNCLFIKGGIIMAVFQNIICYYQTLSKISFPMSTMLFQNIICYYQT